MLHDPAFLAFFGSIWRTNLYVPAVQAVERFRARGELRADFDANSFVRTSYAAHIAYLLTRFSLAPELPLDDEVEIEAMLDIFYRGIRAAPHGAS